MTKPTPQTERNCQPVGRTSAGLRDALFDELDDLRNGRTNATNANATAKLAASIVATVEMEIEVHKMLSKQPPFARAVISAAAELDGDGPVGENLRQQQRDSTIAGIKALMEHRGKAQDTSTPKPSA